MLELNRIDFERARPLFRKMDFHLPLQAILAGNVSASIYVDNPLHPQTALTWTGHRFYLAGAPGNTDLIAAARKIFLENFGMSAWKSGLESYSLYYPTDKWETFIKAMLHQKFPIRSMRSYFTYKASRHELLKPQEGISLRAVDANLLTEQWENRDFLTDEMCSERESIDDFLAKSFGVCLTKGKLIVGWCLSEYNTGHRCEIGICTHEDYRRLGLATYMTRAFIEMARGRDIANIGWHCNSSNIASEATALSTGFTKAEEYPVFIGWFDDATNIAQNGYFAHGRGDYIEALAFYERAMELGEVPDWVFWGAACDAALIGKSDAAIQYLSKSVEHGFDDLEQIKSSKYLVSLHGTDGWRDLLKRLE